MIYGVFMSNKCMILIFDKSSPVMYIKRFISLKKIFMKKTSFQTPVLDLKRVC